MTEIRCVLRTLQNEKPGLDQEYKSGLVDPGALLRFCTNRIVLSVVNRKENFNLSRLCARILMAITEFTYYETYTYIQVVYIGQLALEKAPEYLYS